MFIHSTIGRVCFEATMKSILKARARGGLKTKRKHLLGTIRRDNLIQSFTRQQPSTTLHAQLLAPLNELIKSFLESPERAQEVLRPLRISSHSESISSHFIEVESLNTSELTQFVTGLMYLSEQQYQHRDEALWLLSNLFSDTDIKTAVKEALKRIIIEHRIAERLVTVFIDSTDTKALWPVANALTLSTRVRATLLHSPLPAALQQAWPGASTPQRGVITWCASNLVLGPRVDAALILPLLRLLGHALAAPAIQSPSPREDTLCTLNTVAFAAIHYHAPCLYAAPLLCRVSAVAASGGEEGLSASKVLANLIVHATDNEVTRMIDAGLVHSISGMMSSSSSRIVCLGLWAAANIAVGHQLHVESLAESGILETALGMCRTGERRTRLEAGWLLSNVLCSPSDSSRDLLVEEGCIACVAELVTELSLGPITEVQLVCRLLEGLSNLWGCGLEELGESEFVDTLGELVACAPESVMVMAQELLEWFEENGSSQI
eukprot:gnl/Dysnectes_brevis/3346_a4209_445.p1 GENE.gnl/Dysnectes_brevis/3346_a4209_445~~gnl/Dysnectes_brevis/3346_a4209_445.p1  ORF type:complete len:522 (-),score=120.75 gnl/Dysnectes_brevis/3346_a4209_445:1686-3164(-)